MIRRVSVLILVAGWLMWAGATMVSAQQDAFGGVGLQVVPTVTGELVILRVVPDTPAGRSGLLPGDLIVQVDDFPLRGSDFAQVVAERLWGPAGSPVLLQVRRPGSAGERRIGLERTALDPKLTVTPSAGLPALDAGRH